VAKKRRARADAASLPLPEWIAGLLEEGYADWLADVEASLDLGSPPSRDNLHTALHAVSKWPRDVHDSIQVLVCGSITFNDERRAFHVEEDSAHDAHVDRLAHWIARGPFPKQKHYFYALKRLARVRGIEVADIRLHYIREGIANAIGVERSGVALRQRFGKQYEKARDGTVLETEWQQYLWPDFPVFVYVFVLAVIRHAVQRLLRDEGAVKRAGGGAGGPSASTSHVPFRRRSVISEPPDKSPTSDSEVEMKEVLEPLHASNAREARVAVFNELLRTLPESDRDLLRKSRQTIAAGGQLAPETLAYLRGLAQLADLKTLQKRFLELKQLP
jgi:hypothetical protein